MHQDKVNYPSGKIVNSQTIKLNLSIYRHKKINSMTEEVKEITNLTEEQIKMYDGKRKTAALIALIGLAVCCLSTLGIHCFYLGCTKRACFLYLFPAIFMIILGFFTAFVSNVLWVVLIVFCIIDGVNFLKDTPERFAQRVEKMKDHPFSFG